MNLFNNSFVTLDVESDSLRLLHIKGHSVVNYGESALTSELVEQGVIRDPKATAVVLTRLMKQLKIPGHNVLVSMSSFRTITRFITLPVLQGNKLVEAVKWTARKEMPVPLDTLLIWWQIIGTFDNELRIILLAVPREALVELYKSLYYAHINPRAIDLKEIVLSRIVSDDNAVIVAMENETVSIVVKSGGIPMVTRTIISNPETNEIEDRVSRLNDELARTIRGFNAENPQNLIDTQSCMYFVGGLFSNSVSELFKEMFGRNIRIPDFGLSCPEGFPVNKYAVNIGLYFREVKQRRSLLNPDMSRASRFKV